MKRLRQLITLVLIALTAAAVAQQMRRPAEERDWHGQVLGVPYDFRWPTLDRVKETYWNPEDDRIFPKRVLGLGWGVNFHALMRYARTCCCREEQGPA